MFAKGLIAFPITPMDAGGRVDEAALRRLVRRCADAGVDAVCVLGSTGTYPFVSRDERRRAIEAAAAELRDRLPLHAGVGALRTDDAIRHASDARSAGAAMGLLAPMSYTPLTEDEVETHFRTVAGEGGLPLAIYDNPAATHFSISDALIGRLARVPGIVAVKAPSAPGPDAAGRVVALRSIVPEGFSVGFSGDANAAEVLIAGADAFYSVLAGLFPQPMVALRQLVAAGDLGRARGIDRELMPMWDLMRTFGGVRVMYAAANHLGLTDAEPPRPILPLAGEARDRVESAIERLGETVG